MTSFRGTFSVVISTLFFAKICGRRHAEVLENSSHILPWSIPQLSVVKTDTKVLKSASAAVHTCFADSSSFPFATSEWLDFFDEPLEQVCRNSQLI